MKKISRKQIRYIIDSILSEGSSEEGFRLPGYEDYEGFRLPDDFGQEPQKATGAAKLVAEKLVDVVDNDSGEDFVYGIYADIGKRDEASGSSIVSLTDMSGMGGITNPKDIIDITVIIADEGEGVNIRIKDNKPSYAGRFSEYEFANESHTRDMFIMGPEIRETSVQELAQDILEDIRNRL